jgi:hypothetical protein
MLNQTWPHLAERASKEAAEAVRYRDADPIGKVEIEIEAAIELCRLCIAADATKDALAARDHRRALWERKRLPTAA